MNEAKQSQLKKLVMSANYKVQVVSLIQKDPEIIGDLIELFTDKDINVRTYVSDSLGIALSIEKLKDKIISLLIEKCSEKKFSKGAVPPKVYVIESLGNAAFLGADISSAVPTLNESLKYKNSFVRISAARALVAYTSTREEGLSFLVTCLKAKRSSLRDDATRILKEAAIKEVDVSSAIKPLADAVSDKNSNVRVNSLIALGNAAENRLEISRAIPSIADALKHKDLYTREEAAETLRRISEVGIDISKAIAALENAVGQKLTVPYFLGIKSKSTEALGNALRNTKTRKNALSALINLLAHKNAQTRLSVVRSLGHAAEKGTDISDAIPKLGKMLSDKDSNVRNDSKWAINIAAANKKTKAVVISVLIDLTKEKNPKVRTTANRLLETIKQRS